MSTSLTARIGAVGRLPATDDSALAGNLRHMPFRALGLVIISLLLGVCACSAEETVDEQQQELTDLSFIDAGGQLRSIGVVSSSSDRVCASLAGATPVCSPNGTILRVQSPGADVLVLSKIPSCVEPLGVDSVGTISSLSGEVDSHLTVWRVVASSSLSKLLVHVDTTIEDVWIPLPPGQGFVEWPPDICS